MATTGKEFKVKNGLVSEGSVTATSIIKSGGTSAQYLMADGTTSTGSSSPASPTSQGTLYGRTNTSVYGDTVLGYYAGNAQISGQAFDNTFIGSGAGGFFTSGTGNIFIGADSGSGFGLTPITLITGTNNILIGNGSEPTSSTVWNEITMGNLSTDRFRIPGLDIDWTASTVPAAPQQIIPLDDLSGAFNNIDSRFVPRYQGIAQSITNSLRLLLSINGIIQYVDFPDYVWQSPLPREGFQIDNDGYIAFSEVVPAGSSFDARIMPGPSTAENKRQYPFKAVDILIGG